MLNAKDIKIDKVIAILVSISFVYLIIIANTIFVTYNKGLYLNEFRKQDTSSRVDDPGQKIDNIFNFFRHKEELNPADFDEEQVSHMLDVRDLYDASAIIFWIIFVLDIIAVLLLYYYFRKSLADIVKIARNGAIITISFILLLMLSMVTIFHFMFIKFHEVFFKPGTWTLSSSSTLIRLFPFEFWKDMSMTVVIYSLMASAAILALSLAFLYLYKKQIILSNKH